MATGQSRRDRVGIMLSRPLRRADEDDDDDESLEQ